MSSKGKVKMTTGVTTSKLTRNQPIPKGITSASSQEPSTISHSFQQPENQLFQKLREMKEQMKEQQLQSDHEQEQMTLECDNIIWK